MCEKRRPLRAKGADAPGETIEQPRPKRYFALVRLSLKGASWQLPSSRTPSLTSISVQLVVAQQPTERCCNGRASTQRKATERHRRRFVYSACFHAFNTLTVASALLEVDRATNEDTMVDVSFSKVFDSIIGEYLNAFCLTNLTYEPYWGLTMI